MSTVYVQFADSTEATVVAVFGCPQSATAFPNQAAIDSGDARYQAFINPTATLAGAQAEQVAKLQGAYQTAINQPVTFKNAAGVRSTYAFGSTVTVGGTNAQDLLTQIIDAGSAAWAAGVWFDTNSKAQTMTFADLQGLAAAIEAQETPDEQQLMSLIAQVQAATTVAAVQAITW